MIHKIIPLSLICLSCNLFAQPTRGPILWLKGDSGIVLSSGKISAWLDQSGKNNSVLQNNTSSQPTLLTSILNGHSAVKFHGWPEYFVGPSIFPCRKDYTIIAVIRIDDSTATQNILSGSQHALYLTGDLYPRAVHEDFTMIAISRVKLTPDFGIVTVRYSDINQQAKLYVNGQSGDSLYIRSVYKDSSILIGAFQNSYMLNGAMAELMLFDRQISEDERNSMESSLRVKYALPLGKTLPKSDSTFTSLPANLQLYPRAKDDSAVVSIEGSIYKPAYLVHFDSIYVEGLKNTLPYYRSSSSLVYSEGKAPFSFRTKIHAEMSEHEFIVHLKNSSFDTTIADSHDITCGDVYCIGGESNSTMGYYTAPYRNEYCRTFGTNLLQNIRDTIWAYSDAQKWGDGPSVSGWGLMLQKEILEKQKIPTCFINAGLSGTVINWHVRDNRFPTNLQTIYGRMLYRATKAGVANSVKAIFWYHGEIDYYDYYHSLFDTLYRDWHEDYSNLQKVYVFQIRPGYCVDLANFKLREWQRTLQDSVPDIESISTTMFPDQDGCHFHEDAFSLIADQIFPIIARDFYASKDTTGIICPNIKKAFYTTPLNNEIALVFSPHNCGISGTTDTSVDGIFAILKDYFYPSDETGKIESIRFSGDTAFLKLYSSSIATTISYAPDRYYYGSDSVIYQGPWLKSSRGIGALIFWHFPIDNWQSGVKTATDVISLSLEAVPNLVENITHLKFKLPTSEIAKLSIFDVLGNKVAELVSGSQSEGLHDISFDATRLPAGEYFCRLQTANETLTKKIILTK